MPRKYTASKRGKEMQYSKDDLQKAVNLVRSGAMSLRKASSEFSIPKSTIGDRVSGRFDESSDIKPGRKPVLPPQIEAGIVSNLKLAAARGMGVSRAQLLKRTGTLCKKLKLDTKVFKNSVPGNGWWEGLKKRHPTLAIRKPEKLGTNRARALNETITKEYFKGLGDLLCSLGLEDKPHCIWNADETGLQFEHKPVKVIAEKGSKAVVSRTSNTRQNITIMACGNAMGNKLPPMVIVKGKTSVALHGFNTSAAPKNTKWAVQEKGWMTDELGEMWFKSVFLNGCGPQRPQLLIMDGHSSHESLAILELAFEHNIHLLCLPPHCTHYLQPMDRTVFGPFKQFFDRACSDYLSENCLNTVNKWSFPGLFCKAFEEAMTEGNIKNGFEACGIFPFNPNCLPLSALQPSVPSDRVVSSSALEEEHGNSDMHSATGELPPSATAPSNPLIQSDPCNSVSETEQAETAEAVVLSLADLETNPELVLELITAGKVHVAEDNQISQSQITVDISEMSNSTATVLDPRHSQIVHSSISEIPNQPMSPALGLDPVSLSTSPRIDPPTSSPQSSQVETFPSRSNEADWNFEINSMFLPASQKVKPENVSKSKRNTFHRLLTSEDVI